MPESRTTVSEPTPMASNCSTMSWRYTGGVTTPASVAPVRRTYSCASRAAFLSQLLTSDSTRRSGPPRRPRQTQFGVAQAFDVVAQARGLLEVEVGGRRLHLLLQ